MISADLKTELKSSHGYKEPGAITLLGGMFHGKRIADTGQKLFIKKECVYYRITVTIKDDVYYAAKDFLVYMGREGEIVLNDQE